MFPVLSNTSSYGPLKAIQQPKERESCIARFNNIRHRQIYLRPQTQRIHLAMQRQMKYFHFKTRLVFFKDNLFVFIIIQFVINT